MLPFFKNKDVPLGVVESETTIPGLPDACFYSALPIVFSFYGQLADHLFKLLFFAF